MSLTLKQIENASPKTKPYKLADSGGLCLLINLAARSYGAGVIAMPAKRR